MSCINSRGTSLTKKQYTQLLRVAESGNDHGENRTTFISLERRGLVVKRYDWVDLPQGRRQLKISVALTEFGRQVVSDLKSRGFTRLGKRVNRRENPANTQEFAQDPAR